MLPVSAIKRAESLKKSIDELNTTIEQIKKSKSFKFTSDDIPSYLQVTKPSTLAKVKEILITAHTNILLSKRNELRELGFDPDR